MSTDETTNEDRDTRLRMRRRFQELKEAQRKREEASSAWVMVAYIGFLFTFIGFFMMLIFLGVVPLTLEIIISAGVILFGVFFIAIGFFLRNSPSLVMDDM
ncbi:MAG: hypothetical protein GF411_12795 [Candidatus Lokiarchaeota archaeon]|nr:hypothetical protein [Candidatus Lokiarchaeota archaeon]